MAMIFFLFFPSFRSIGQAVGISRARAEKKFRGRKSLVTDELKKSIKEQVSLRQPVTKIAKNLGVSRATIYQALKQLNL
jgi:DNA invertase Pin-like site-specific DNA recombinase